MEKKIEGNTNESTRYIRCLILDINNKKYLVDVENKEIREFDEKELEEKKNKNLYHIKNFLEADLIIMMEHK